MSPYYKDVNGVFIGAKALMEYYSIKNLVK